MAVLTYTKTGNKATMAVKLNKEVFGAKPDNHQLLKQAYDAYLANARNAHATTKQRGQVRGGGKKPWRQKGTGRARFGSSRNPIWRGGGITFGPTGEQNYIKQLPTAMKRKALRQALSLAADEGRLSVIESFAMDGKTKDMANLLAKLGTKGNVLCVVANRDIEKERATRNISGLQVVSAKYLTVYDLMNADSVLMSQDALKVVHEWLGGKSE